MKNTIFLLLVILFSTLRTNAQNNFVATKHSVIDSTEYLFPAMAGKIKRAGHSVPIPTGLMFNYAYQQNNIYIDNFKMGTDPNNLKDMSFVGFSPTHSEVMAYNVRLDLWVLPFLNIYGNYAYSFANSSTQITAPLNFPINTKPETETYGFGFTTAYGWNNWFMASNFNFSWSDSKAVENLTKSQIISVRFGRNFKVGDHGHIAPTFGLQYQHMSPYTLGSIKTDKIKNFLNNETVQNAKHNLEERYNEWYGDLSFPQKKVVDEAVSVLQDKTAGFESIDKIYYSFNKYKESNFAAIIGVSYFLNNKHMFRAETAIGSGFVNAVFSYNYRFGLYKKRKIRQLGGSNSF